MQGRSADGAAAFLQGLVGQGAAVPQGIWIVIWSRLGRWEGHAVILPGLSSFGCLRISISLFALGESDRRRMRSRRRSTSRAPCRRSVPARVLNFLTLVQKGLEFPAVLANAIHP